MKNILAFVIVAATIIACGNSNSNAGTTSAAKTTAAAAGPDGEKIYKQYCVTCHGLYGDMGASGAHDLTASALTVEERIEVITNGRNTMTGFKGILNEERIQAVAEYSVKLKKK